MVSSIPCDVTGLDKITIRGYECPRCKKSTGYLAPDGKDKFFFCATLQCLDDDSHHGKLVQPYKSKSEQDKRDTPGAVYFGLGGRFESATIYDWIATDAIRSSVLRWLNHPKKFLVNLGITGCGKTYLCAALLNYLWKKSNDVFYIQARRLFQMVHEAISQDKDQYQVIEKIAKKPILILDDIGSSTNTEWQKEMILDLIDRRYENEMPTVITSNFDEHQLKEILGQRTSSRICSKDNFIIQVWDVDKRGL